MAWLCFFVLAGSSPALTKKGMIQIKGSDTMVNLIQILAESFMAKHPGTPIAVLGGGSGTGIAALINGTCEIANISREISEKEARMAVGRGASPTLFVIAIDGLTVVVNASNTVDELSVDQIGAVYRGEITNWKAIGGPDMRISLYGRQSNSGTYVFFQEFVLGNQDYSPQMKQMNGNAQIIEGIIKDKAGIGYVGVGYILNLKTGEVRKGLKVLDVSKDSHSDVYSPLDEKAVEKGDYPIVRALYQVTREKPQGGVLDFLKFATGPEGQKIVAEEGFFPISSLQRTANERNLK